MKTFSAYLNEEKEKPGKADIIDFAYGSVKNKLEHEVEMAETFTLGRFLLFTTSRSGIQRSTVDYFISDSKTLLDDCKEIESKIKAVKGWKEKDFPVKDDKGYEYQWSTFNHYYNLAKKNVEYIKKYVKNGLPLYKLLKKLKPSTATTLMDDTKIEVYDISGKIVYKGIVDNFELKREELRWLGKSLGLWVIVPKRQSVGDIGTPAEFKGVYVVRAA